MIVLESGKCKSDADYNNSNLDKMGMVVEITKEMIDSSKKE